MTMLQVTDECTINTNSGRFPQEGAETGCGQCTNKKENHGKIYSTVHTTYIVMGGGRTFFFYAKIVNEFSLFF